MYHLVNTVPSQMWSGLLYVTVFVLVLAPHHTQSVCLANALWSNPIIAADAKEFAVIMNLFIIDGDICEWSNAVEGKGAKCVEARAMVREEIKEEEAGEPGSNLDRGKKQGQDWHSEKKVITKNWLGWILLL